MRHRNHPRLAKTQDLRILRGFRGVGAVQKTAEVSVGSERAFEPAGEG